MSAYVVAGTVSSALGTCFPSVPTAAFQGRAAEGASSRVGAPAVQREGPTSGGPRVRMDPGYLYSAEESRKRKQWRWSWVWGEHVGVHSLWERFIVTVNLNVVG